MALFYQGSEQLKNQQLLRCEARVSVLMNRANVRVKVWVGCFRELDE